MSEQSNFLAGTGADLVFPPRDGLLPWVLPRSMGCAASEGDLR